MNKHEFAVVMSRRQKQSEERVIAALKKNITTSAAEELVAQLVSRVAEAVKAHIAADEEEA